MPEKRQLVCNMCYSLSCGDSLWRGIPVKLSCVRAMHIVNYNRCSYVVVTEVECCEDSSCESS